MPTFTIAGTKKTVKLDKDNFRAKGGEGAIHIIDDTVYKICDPGMMIPKDKIEELLVLDHPRIIRPENVLLDKNKEPVGYTMKLVPNKAMPLARILTKTYREREKVTSAIMAELVQQIADGIRFIHSKPKYLQIDGNENNYMVTQDYKDVYFIDVNSFQTPNFRATAIQPGICCYKAGNHFTQLTDWYSFEIISWYMFTAIHPFRGSHPKYPNLKTFMIDQMKAGISILNPDCRFPKNAVYFPFHDYIPGGSQGAYMQWYRAILEEGKLIAPPLTYQATINIVVSTIKEIIGSNNFVIEEIRHYASNIVDYFVNNSKDIIVTHDKVYLNHKAIDRPAKKFTVVFTPTINTPVAIWLDNEDVKLQNLETNQPISTIAQANDLMLCEGRIYLLVGSNIFEGSFIERYDKITLTTKHLASVMPQATTFYQGVAFQDMFGQMLVSIFPQTGFHQQLKLPQLNDYRIIDAKYEGNVLMVVGSHKTTGIYDRFIYRFAKEWDSFDVRIVENINYSGLNFTVTTKGLCVCLTEEEKIEIFSNQKDATSIKAITDPAIHAGFKLHHNDAQVRFTYGEKLFNFSVKKP